MTAQMMTAHIVIAEDEPRIASFVRKGLISAGYRTSVADTGPAAIALASRSGVDLLLLDVGLPEIDGFGVVRALRKHDRALPVIMLTARSSTQDVVAGLDAGASDYICKPFTFDELLARVRSRLRESMRTTPTLIRGDVTLDLHARTARVAGHAIELSAREFALAEQFLLNPEETLSRELLLKRVWGLDFDPGSNIVDVYVRYLRNKLGPQHITTVRGHGYRWK